MSIKVHSPDHSITRRLATSLLAAAITLSTAAASLAADAIVLRVGDQKGATVRCSTSPATPRTCPTRSNGRNFLPQRRSSKH